MDYRYLMILLFLSFCFSKNMIAQCPTDSEVGTLERLHFIPPIYAKDGGLSNDKDIGDHYLYLSTTEVVPFTVTIQNTDGVNGIVGGINETVTISKNSPGLITLSAAPYGAANFGALGIVSDAGLNTINTTDGLILIGQEKFYANIRQRSNSQGGSLISKGQTALGKRFRTGHMNMDASGGSNKKSHFISVMAYEDSTTVIVDDISPGVTFVGGNPTSFTLDKYESYVLGVRMDLDGNDSIPNDLNGTLLTSDKSIIVNTGSFLGGSIPNSAGRDLGMDQILPTIFNGTQFIVTKGKATTNADVLETPIVVADIDNTEIYLKGAATPIDTIDAGEYYVISGNEYPTSGAMFIRTSQPAGIYQTTNANNMNGNGLNYVAAILPNLEIQDVLLSDVNQLGDATIGIIAPITATITIDGTVLTGGTTVPGISEFVLYTVEGEIGNVEVLSTEPYFLSMTTLSGVRGSAGFVVGFPNSHAVNDLTTVEPDSIKIIDVQENDVPGIYTWTVSTLCQNPSNGMATINSDGTISYDPDFGFFGLDTFYYVVENGLGLLDIARVVVAVDSDGDGKGNYTDIDKDDDGIPDSIEIANAFNSGDTDGDGIDDEFDLDSDNDGIYDLVEAGHGAVDIDNNGRVDGFTGSNGLLDAVETVSESGVINYSVLNSDTDSNFNYIDLDADGDGIPDNIEAQLSATYSPPSGMTDNRGVMDNYMVGLIPLNTDSLDQPDYLDLDSDNDTQLDIAESGLTLTGVVGNNGLDNAIDIADDFLNSNGTINNPVGILTDSQGDCCGIPLIEDLNYRDRFAPEDCVNGFDDDFDGLIDCDDPNCVTKTIIQIVREN